MQTTEDWRVVFESRTINACNDRALVLSAIQIPHRVIHDAAGCALVVPADYSPAAVRELRLYDDENPPVRPQPRPRARWHDARPGIAAYTLTVLGVAWLAGTAAFSTDWFTAGRVDGALIRGGEWWRLFTALTLHSGLSHLLGNILFGSFFGLLAGRLLGSGVAWLAIVITAAAGNLSNTLLLASAHRSIGASTAVFAALGLVAGYVWHAKLMSQERWVYRLGPIVGGIALLAYTGMGGGEENVDVGAHLMGFVCGFAGGLLLVRVMPRLQSTAAQYRAGAVGFSLIVVAWMLALHASN